MEFTDVRDFNVTVRVGSETHETWGGLFWGEQLARQEHLEVIAHIAFDATLVCLGDVRSGR